MDDINSVNEDKSYSEIKKERFKKIAEQRTNKIIKTLRLLGNCANKSNYDYTDEEVKKIFVAIEKELKGAKNKFFDIEKEEIFKL